MWRLIEPIHAVTYFAPEAVESASRAGYRGFWMGYFACRLAPLGPVGPQVATAVCYGFAPTRVARALPDAWAFAGPEKALSARLTGATETLRRVSSDALELQEAANLIWEASVNAYSAGRVLAAANQGLPKPDDPLGVIWQAATTFFPLSIPVIQRIWVRALKSLPCMPSSAPPLTSPFPLRQLPSRSNRVNRVRRRSLSRPSTQLRSPRRCS